MKKENVKIKSYCCSCLICVEKSREASRFYNCRQTKSQKYRQPDKQNAILSNV